MLEDEHGQGGFAELLVQNVESALDRLCGCLRAKGRGGCICARAPEKLRVDRPCCGKA